MAKTALIVGAGSGILASFARLLAKEGYRVALASRDPTKLTRFCHRLRSAQCREGPRRRSQRGSR